jgi:hypothetical protein
MMIVEAHTAALLIVTTGVGFAMAFAGINKNALEWRRRQRLCPSCGRLARDCTCS